MKSTQRGPAATLMPSVPVIVSRVKSLLARGTGGARRLSGNCKGVTAVETIIALAILGTVAVVFLLGLSTGLKAVLIADERSTAQTLAQSQMEYVKSQEYSTDAWSYTITSSDRTPSPGPSWWDLPNNKPPLLSSDYATYVAELQAEDFDADEDGDIDDDDAGIRRITVTVKHHGNEVLVLQDYKVDR
ncbi:MAG: type II secretion system protein [Candidatus Eisenbacteria sp.]|nr:type II secretion system protein [Candidatus Eisenbacteria bacterium]